MQITVGVKIDSPIEKVWHSFTDAEHIIHWNFASDEWHCPTAINDLQPGGLFSWRMEAKDGSMGFDYTGNYLDIEKFKSISLELDDGRQVNILFKEKVGTIELVETFEADEESAELQKQGWQAILNNFKNYTEKY